MEKSTTSRAAAGNAMTAPPNTLKALVASKLSISFFIRFSFVCPTDLTRGAAVRCIAGRMIAWRH